ncbi:hypothetical protein [Brachybacterium sacelli]
MARPREQETFAGERASPRFSADGGRELWDPPDLWDPQVSECHDVRAL